MGRKKILKLINGVVVTSYMASLTPVAAMETETNDQIVNESESISSSEEIIIDESNTENSEVTNNDDLEVTEEIIEETKTEEETDALPEEDSLEAVEVENTVVPEDASVVTEDEMKKDEKEVAVAAVEDNWLNREVARQSGKALDEITEAEYQAVTDINLDMVTGDITTIPSDIAKLTNLKTLNLSGVGLTGTIPVEIGSLTQLTTLDLSLNNLTGSIPTEIGNLTNLKSFKAYGNSLSGAIPTEIGNLTKVTELHLFNNSLTGSIPAEIGSMTALTDLNLSENNLSGAIPTELGNLSNLQGLDLAENNLSGAIPSEIGNLSSVVRVRLSSNSLTGEIPSTIGNLTSVKYLTLNDNGLTGSIPTSVGTLAALNTLNLQNNELTGAIPSEIGSISTLAKANLSNNNLTGEIPTSIGSLSALQVLNVENNKLTGNIPNELASLPLSFSATTGISSFANNQFIGTVPEALKAKSTDAFANNFLEDVANQKGIKITNDAAIRVKLGEALSIDAIKDDYKVVNSTGAETLETLSNVYSVETVVESNTLFDEHSVAKKLGTTKAQIKITGTNILSVNEVSIETYNDVREDNWVNRAVASEVGKEVAELLDSDYLLVTDLDVSNQNLSGVIPSDIAKLTNLQSLNLSGNKFVGEVPAEVFNITTLTSLNLSNNGFTGEIPAEISTLTSLKSLDLSHNKFEGEIPTELTTMQFDSLKLNNNKLYGEVPADLANCKSTPLPYRSLDNFDFSNNQFMGDLDGGVEAAFTADAFANNLLNNVANQKTIEFKETSEIRVKIGETLTADLALDKINVVDKDGVVLEEALNPNCSLEMTVTNPDLFKGSNVADKTGTTTITAKITGTSIATRNAIDVVVWNDAVEDNWLNREVARQVGRDLADLVPENYLAVTSISLPSQGLTGAIPSEISKLENLTVLDLSGNELTGELDSALFSLTALQELNLSDNKLSGEISPEIFSLQNLRKLNLSNNEFTGTLPGEIGGLTLLTELLVNDNNFTGTLPNELLNLFSLLNSDFSNNNFVGDVSDFIDQGFAEDAFKNNFVEGVANQNTIEFAVTTDMNLNFGSTLDVAKVLENLVVKNSEGTIIDLDSSVEVEILSDDISVIDNALKAVDFGTANITARVKNSSITTSNSIAVVIADSEKPTITVNKDDNWTNSSVTVEVVVTDNHQVDKIVLPDGTEVNGTKATFVANANGDFTVKAYDVSGNESTLVIKVSNIDTDTPVISTEISAPKKDGSVDLKIDAIDSTSGVKEILVNGISIDVKNPVFNVIKNGEYEIVVRDFAGNESKKTIEVTTVVDVVVPDEKPGDDNKPGDTTKPGDDNTNKPGNGGNTNTDSNNQNNSENNVDKLPNASGVGVFAPILALMSLAIGALGFKKRK